MRFISVKEGTGEDRDEAVKNKVINKFCGGEEM